MFAVIFFFREVIFADRPGKIAKMRTRKNFVPHGTQSTALPNSKPGQNNTTTNTQFIDNLVIIISLVCGLRLKKVGHFRI